MGGMGEPTFKGEALIFIKLEHVLRQSLTDMNSFCKQRLHVDQRNFIFKAEHYFWSETVKQSLNIDRFRPRFKAKP